MDIFTYLGNVEIIVDAEVPERADESAVDAGRRGRVERGGIRAFAYLLADRPGENASAATSM